MKVIDAILFRASIHSNPKLALEVCREAEQKAAEYDPDPFYAGAIAKCLALSERHMISHYRYVACDHYARGLQALEAVRADHPRREDIERWLHGIRQDRAELGCGTRNLP